MEEDEYYTTITGSTIAGNFLHKLALEFMLGAHSGVELTQIDGKTWVAVKRTDWRKCYNLQEGNARIALRLLKGRELIDIAVYDVNGLPTIHIRPSDKFWNMLENHY